jgi:hypothetical protein
LHALLPWLSQHINPFIPVIARHVGHVLIQITADSTPNFAVKYYSHCAAVFSGKTVIHITIDTCNINITN